MQKTITAEFLAYHKEKARKAALIVTPGVRKHKI